MNYNIFDTHNHIQDFRTEAKNVWIRAQENNVRNCVVIGTNPKDAIKASRIASELPGVYLAVGIHPVNAGKNGQHISALSQHFKNNKLVALGETGLDYYRKNNPKKSIQISNLRDHIVVAEKLDLPLVIHIRPTSASDSDAWDIHNDLLSVLREEPTVTCLIHCFSGGIREAEKLVDAGHYISFAGNITHNTKLGSRLRQAASEIPLDKILVETDAPYVRPISRKGKNEPAYIIDTLKEVARCQSKPFLTVAETIWSNSKTVLGIKH